ncbi:MAG: PQQ-dependent sugar dehydrogenase [Anaerolineae bacterium]
MNRFFVLTVFLVFLVAGCQDDDHIATPLTPTSATETAQGPATVVATSLAPASPTPINPFELNTVTPTAVPPTATPTATPTNTPRPTPVAVVEVAGASLPPGFSFVKFADFVRPTSLTADADGRIYATSQDGSIGVFEDVDGDGRADVDHLFSSGFYIPLGITIRPGTNDVWVSSNSKISILRDTDSDFVADEAVNFVNGLPVGLHQNDNLKFGPDGMLYMGVGSTCDACAEADSRSATIMRFDPETGEGEVFATGMRNPYDLAFHPFTGDLLATDNGRDGLGMDAPGEELNHIIQGGDYGFPDCWDDGQGPGCDGTITAIAFFEPHASADSLDFYTGDKFPPPYLPEGTAVSLFVGVFGSWLKTEAETGIAHVRLTPDGDSYQTEVAWFAQWPGGMPLGLIVGTDGALYVGDYINDAIYRISYWP